MHAGVVCRDNDKTAVNAVIRRGKDRIRRDIQADMLHGTQTSYAGNGRPVRHFCRDLFIRRPLTVQFILILRQLFKDFGAGCARICRADPDARFISTAGNSLVSGKQMFHGFSPYPYPYKVCRSVLFLTIVRSPAKINGVRREAQFLSHEERRNGHCFVILHS